MAVPEWELLHGDGDWEGLGVGGGMNGLSLRDFFGERSRVDASSTTAE